MRVIAWWLFVLRRFAGAVVKRDQEGACLSKACLDDPGKDHPPNFVPGLDGFVNDILDSPGVDTWTGPPMRQHAFALFNARSGGGEGAAIAAGIRNLSWGVPAYDAIEVLRTRDQAALKDLRSRMVASLEVGTRARMICVGGDGTVSLCYRIVDLALAGDARRADLLPAFAMLPVGTGNDLARSTGWGGAAPAVHQLESYLGRLLGGDCSLDRRGTCTELKPFAVWQLRWYKGRGCEGEEEPTMVMSDGSPLPEDRLRNMYLYLSSGVTAELAFYFDAYRDKDLSLFAKGLQWINKKMANKYLYGVIGAEILAQGRVHSLGRKYSLLTTSSASKDWSESWKLQNFFSVDILNVPSMAGGWNAWGRDSPSEQLAAGFRPPTFQDEVLEVAGVADWRAVIAGQVKKDGSWKPSHHIVQPGHACLSWGTPTDNPAREGEQHAVYIQVDGEAIQAKEAASVELSFKEYVWTIVNADVSKKYPFYDSIFPGPPPDLERDLRLSQFA
jgi:hypothetical protein